MLTSLNHLPVARQEQIRKIAEFVKKAINPEKVILYGIYAPAGVGMKFHLPDQLQPFLAGYDILVVTRRKEFRADHTLQKLVETRCRFKTPVTVLIHDIDYVNNQLSQGQYFFSTLIREAVLLYDACSAELVPAAPPDLTRVRDLAKADFEKWGSRASAFLRSALFNRQQGEWRLAVFLLHQAAEQTYQALLLVFTGFKPCTHNLDKLRRYTNRFSIELALLFPRNTPEEDRLFKLLLQGYVDARYKENYQISEDEVGLLAERVGRLQSISSNLCRNRFTLLDKLAGNTK